MPFELGVTEVGPAEYPLIEVLRETVFAEVGHRSLTTIAEDLEGRADILSLIAHLEGNPVGFKVGYRAGPGLYYSKCGGVLKDYRRHGLARRMQEWQHGFAKARGYRRVYFNSFNHFRGMILFGLASGFRPVGAEWHPLGAMSFKFMKELTGDMSLPPPPVATAQLSAPRVELDADDAAGLRACLAAGYDLSGIEQCDGRPRVILVQPVPHDPSSI